MKNTKNTKKMKRLPRAELDIMKAVWSLESPIPESELAQLLQDKHAWAAHPAQAPLARLVERGFLRAEKSE
ncbi:MAG: BlaI/MecI/CopY family transcriptional regulator, partial [Oscillospiraceae bacterium]|nr:BlaI/MecI/CopY family transcriptional regulator [Oscillospiraceae bacterium]